MKSLLQITLILLHAKIAVFQEKIVLDCNQRCECRDPEKCEEDRLQSLYKIPGTRGPPGMKGGEGQKGYPGLPGPTGLPGFTGNYGLSGLPGQPGTCGRNGVKGEKGFPGRRGEDGIPGINGPLGHIGDRGEIGEEGFNVPKDRFYALKEKVAKLVIERKQRSKAFRTLG